MRFSFKRIYGLLLLTSFSALAYGACKNCAVHGAYGSYRIVPSENVNAWFVGMGGGVDSISFANRTRSVVTNAAGNAADLFIQSLRGELAGTFDASLGYLWDLRHHRNISLFFEYDYFGKVSDDGQRWAYGVSADSSIYSYDIKRQAFLLATKMDLIQWHHVSPYVEVGAGISLNRFENFVNNVSVTRVLPFPNRTTAQMCYVLGLGMDWHAARSWLLSVGYRFGYWGNVESGNITTDANSPPVVLPAPVRLQHTLYSNQVLARVSYLFAG